MYNLDIYNKKVEFDNMIYSIDKIRLKTYITYAKFQELEFELKTAYKNRIGKFWLSDRIMCFHYNYTLEFDGFSFYIGFLHNNESVNYNKDNLEYNFTIEFNPNKAKDNQLIHRLLDRFPNWYLRSLDLAIDIPINILDIIVDISGRLKMQKISYGDDNVTYNIGKGDGRLKIYNKKRESDLNIVGHLTRVEVTKEFDDFPISNIKRFNLEDSIFPCLYLNQYIFSFSDYDSKNRTLMAILYAVQSGYPVKNLTRDYKKKLKELLEGGSKIKFNKKSAIEVFNQTIFYYFVRRDSKQIIF